MGDTCARFKRRNGRSAGVGEEVEHLDGSAGGPDDIGGHIPIDRLLGEQTRMFEPHGLYIEFQILKAYLPHGRHL